MPHQEYLCSHTRTVEDDREGTIVCTECGLVLEDKLFLNGKDFSFSESPLPNLPLFEMKEEIKEILSKANLPESYVNKIPKALLKKSKKCIPYIVYKTLNDDGNPISLKEISAVSGISDSEIYNMQEKDKVIIIKPDLMIERFCTMLNLNFWSRNSINSFGV